MKSILPLILASILAVSACSEIKAPLDPDAVPTGKNSGATHKIEYRVNGNPNSVRVRYSNALDGLVQVVTTPPYAISVQTQLDSLFVSIDATPISYPFVTFPF